MVSQQSGFHLEFQLAVNSALQLPSCKFHNSHHGVTAQTAGEAVKLRVERAGHDLSGTGTGGRDGRVGEHLRFDGGHQDLL